MRWLLPCRRFLAAIPLLLCAPAAAAALRLPHVPHDNCYDVAVGPRAGGGLEIVLAGNRFNKVLHSLDGGLSWGVLSDDGLEATLPTRVVYWADPVQPLFVIGTESGVWFYDPATREVVSRSEGLGGAFISELAVSRTGASSVFAATAGGAVFRWDAASLSWVEILGRGVGDSRAQVAVVPDFDPQASPGRDRTVLAGIAGVLYVSTNGGRDWSGHAQFLVQAGSEDDWMISAIAFADNYHEKGVALLGRAKDDPASPTGTAGEIWRTGDYCQTWTLVKTLPSSVRALEVTASSPNGTARFFAAVEQYADRRFPGRELGVFRSNDGGFTWSDHGNHQDFRMEAPATGSVLPTVEQFVGLAASPYYEDDLTVFYARAEGLFRSRDEGDIWIQMRSRPERHLRDIETVVDGSGDLLVFGSAYGSATMKWNHTRREAELLDFGKVHYQQPVAISPSFTTDHVLMVGGSTGYAIWADPAQPKNNTLDAHGWRMEPGNPIGYVRTIEYSPHFDASGTIGGGDQTVFWSTTTGAIRDATFRSEDGGLTWDLLDTTDTGHDLNHVQSMAIAPTYDPHIYGGKTDVFAAANEKLFYLLGNGLWHKVWDGHAQIVTVTVDPSWSRPDNPRVILAMDEAPYLVEVIADLADVRINPIRTMGLEGRIQDMVLSPEFEKDQQVFVTTWGRGVWKVGLGSADPLWQKVGVGFPDCFGHSIAISPNFADDQLLFVGTSIGMVAGRDRFGAEWEHIRVPYTLDNRAPGVTFFAPNNNSNPAPERPWPWPVPLRGDIMKRHPEIELVGQDIAVTGSDGSLVTLETLASAVEVRTQRGPGTGAVHVEIFEISSGKLLTELRERLDSPLPFTATKVRVEIPGGTAAVQVRVSAVLAPGESFGFDAITIEP